MGCLLYPLSQKYLFNTSLLRYLKLNKNYEKQIYYNFFNENENLSESFQKVHRQVTLSSWLFHRFFVLIINFLNIAVLFCLYLLLLAVGFWFYSSFPLLEVLFMFLAFRSESIFALNFSFFLFVLI